MIPSPIIHSIMVVYFIASASILHFMIRGQIDQGKVSLGDIILFLFLAAVLPMVAVASMILIGLGLLTEAVTKKLDDCVIWEIDPDHRDSAKIVEMVLSRLKDNPDQWHTNPSNYKTWLEGPSQKGQQCPDATVLMVSPIGEIICNNHRLSVKKSDMRRIRKAALRHNDCLEKIRQDIKRRKKLAEDADRKHPSRGHLESVELCEKILTETTVSPKDRND
jgi:hypothetical protein